MITSNEWPADFKGETKGKPRYEDVTFYCRQKGFPVSDSAVGRLSARLRRTAKVGIAKTDPSDFEVNVRGHLFDMLAVACQQFAEMRWDYMKEEKIEFLTGELHSTEEKLIGNVEEMIYALFYIKDLLDLFINYNKKQAEQ